MARHLQKTAQQAVVLYTVGVQVTAAQQKRRVQGEGRSPAVGARDLLDTGIASISKCGETLYMFVYTSIYICMYVYIYIYMHMNICIYIYSLSLSLFSAGRYWTATTVNLSWYGHRDSCLQGIFLPLFGCGSSFERCASHWT